MKRFCLFLCFCLLAVTTACGAAPRFDNMRTVLVVHTTQEQAANNYAARYMQSRLKEPFRIPYWDRLETTTFVTPQELTQDRLRALADQYEADIVIVPLVHTWSWTQRHFFFWDDDEIFTECMYNLTVYAYDRKADTLKSYSARGYERKPLASLNNPNDILTPAMDTILKKLPYKRIPTDIEGLRD